MKSNFYDQGMNVIAHHYFSGKKDVRQIRHNVQFSTASLSRWDNAKTWADQEKEQNGRERIPGQRPEQRNGDISGYIERRKPANDQAQAPTDQSTQVIRSLGELNSPMRFGQSGQMLDLRDHRISPEVYAALARGEQVEVQMQQMAPERVNLFTPLLASAMQIFGGMAGGVAYNEDLSQVITGKGGTDKGQLGKAAEFVNKHGTAYDLGFGTGEHIDVVAKFRVLNEESKRKPPVPPMNNVLPPRRIDDPDEPKPGEDIKTVQPSDSSEFRERPIDTAPKGKKASPITNPDTISGNIRTNIGDVIDADFFKLMTTPAYSMKFDWEKAAKSSGVSVDDLKTTLSKQGIDPDKIAANITKEGNAASFLQKYNTKGEDVVVNDGRGKNPGIGYKDDGKGNTINSAVILDLDVHGKSQGGYKYGLEQKAQAVSDYVLTAQHCTDVFDQGVGNFKTPLHEGISKKDVDQAKDTLRNYPNQNSEQLLNTAKELEKTNPKEAAAIYSALFLQVENNTGVENGNLGAGHISKMREQILKKSNILVDGTRAINTLVNANDGKTPIKAKDLEAALSANPLERDEQEKGLSNLIKLYELKEGKTINPENITDEQALDLLRFSEKGMNEIQDSLKREGYIGADPELQIVNAQIDAVIGQEDTNLMDGNNNGIGALRTLINTGTTRVAGTGASFSPDAQSFNKIVEAKNANVDQPLSADNKKELTRLSGQKSKDGKPTEVALKAKEMLDDDKKLVLDIAASKAPTGSSKSSAEYNSMIGAREYIDPFVKDLSDKGIDLTKFPSLKTNGKLDNAKVYNMMTDLSADKTDSKFTEAISAIKSLPTEQSSEFINKATVVKEKFEDFQLNRTQNQEANDVIKRYMGDHSIPGVVDLIESDVTNVASAVHVNETNLGNSKVMNMVKDSLKLFIKADMVGKDGNPILSKDDINKINGTMSAKDAFTLFKKMENALNEKYNPELLNQSKTLTTDVMFGAAHITNLQRSLYDATSKVSKAVAVVDTLYEGKTLSETEKSTLQNLVNDYNKSDRSPKIDSIDQLKTNKDLAVKLLDFSENTLLGIKGSIDRSGSGFNQYGQLAELSDDIDKVLITDAKTGVRPLKNAIDSNKVLNLSSDANIKKVNDYQKVIETEIAEIEKAVTDGASTINGKPTAKFVEDLKEKYLRFKTNFNLDDTATKPNLDKLDKVLEKAKTIPSSTETYQNNLQKNLNLIMDSIKSGAEEVKIGDKNVRIIDHVRALETDYQSFILDRKGNEELGNVAEMADLFTKVHLEAGLKNGNTEANIYGELQDALGLAAESADVNVDQLLLGKAGKSTADSKALTDKLIENVTVPGLGNALKGTVDEKGDVNKEKLFDILSAKFEELSDKQVREFLAIAERLLKKAKPDVNPPVDLTGLYEEAQKAGNKTDDALNISLEKAKVTITGLGSNALAIKTDENRVFSAK